MLQVMGIRKRAFVWKSKQNQCDKLLNAYQLAMTRRMDLNHTDRYQVSLCLYLKHKLHEFVPLFTLNLSHENV